MPKCFQLEGRWIFLKDKEPKENVFDFTPKIRHMEIKQDAWVTFKMRKNRCVWGVIYARNRTSAVCSWGSEWFLLCSFWTQRAPDFKLYASFASHRDVHLFTWKEKHYKKYSKNNPTGVSSQPAPIKEKIRICLTRYVLNKDVRELVSLALKLISEE